MDQIFIEIVSRDGIKKLTRPVPSRPAAASVPSRYNSENVVPSRPRTGRDGTGPASRGALLLTIVFVILAKISSCRGENVSFF